MSAPTVEGRMEMRIDVSTASFDALMDPFSFFYAPETDPNRLPATGGTVYTTLPASGARSWMNCSGRAALTPVGTVTFPHLRRPGYLDRLRSMSAAEQRKYLEGSWFDEEAEVTLKTPQTSIADELAKVAEVTVFDVAPRCRVMRGKVELGTIPRDFKREGSARHFTVGGTRRAGVQFGYPPEGLIVGGDCFVMAYELRWSDDGWSAEMALDAGDLDVELLRRLPGWVSTV